MPFALTKSIGLTPRKLERQLSEPMFGDVAMLDSLLEISSHSNLVKAVVQSPAFQRLKDIRFLGAIDYLVYPNGGGSSRRHSRFEHSLGVATLAGRYAKACSLDSLDEKHCVVAALLHDVGHGPLSHSLEPVFRQYYGITHHEASELIVRGLVPLGHEFVQIFRSHGIDREEVLSLISGDSTEPHCEIFSSPLNVDTLEGISRAYTYMAPHHSVPTASRILDAFIYRRGPEDVRILDGFWELKNTVYQQLINSKTGVMADHLCREYMRRHIGSFWKGNYFRTEFALRKEHPQLFTLLKDLRAAPSFMPADYESVVEYSNRIFYIDASVKLTDRTKPLKRYRQRKEPAQLQLTSAKKV